MAKFPRGTLPPYAWLDPVAKPAPTAATPAAPARSTCDLSIICPTCSTQMQPEHAHYRCATCGYRDSCCF